MQRVGLFYVWAFCELRFGNLGIPLPAVREMEVEDAVLWVKEHFLPRTYWGNVRTIEQMEQYMRQAQVPKALRTYLMLCVEMTISYREWEELYCVSGRVDYELSRVGRRYLQWFSMW